MELNKPQKYEIEEPAGYKRQEQGTATALTSGVGQSSYRKIGPGAESLQRLVNRFGGSRCGALVGHLGNPARLLTGTAGHIEEHDHGIRVQLPQ